MCSVLALGRLLFKMLLCYQLRISSFGHTYFDHLIIHLEINSYLKYGVLVVSLVMNGLISLHMGVNV